MKKSAILIKIILIYFSSSCEIESFEDNNNQNSDEWSYCIEYIECEITIKSNLNMQPIHDALVHITYNGWSISKHTNLQGKVNLELYSENNGGLIECYDSHNAVYGPHTISIEVSQSDFYPINDSREFTCGEF